SDGALVLLAYYKALILFHFNGHGPNRGFYGSVAAVYSRLSGPECNTGSGCIVCSVASPGSKAQRRPVGRLGARGLLFGTHPVCGDRLVGPGDAVGGGIYLDQIPGSGLPALSGLDQPAPCQRIGIAGGCPSPGGLAYFSPGIAGGPAQSQGGAVFSRLPAPVRGAGSGGGARPAALAGTGVYPDRDPVQWRLRADGERA